MRMLLGLWLTLLSLPSWSHQRTDLHVTCERMLTTLVGMDGRTVQGVSTLHLEDTALFREKLSHGLVGLKGVAATEANGEIQVWFWPSTAANGAPTQVHHRDAAAGLLQQRAEKMLEAAAESVDQEEKLFAEAQRLSEFAELLGGQYSARKSRNLEITNFEGLQGFQFSGRVNPRSKVFEIVNFDVDSSLTAAQARAIRLGQLEPSEDWLRALAAQIRAVHNRIPNFLRAYSTVRLTPSLYEQLNRSNRHFLNQNLADLGLHVTQVPSD